MNWIAVSTTGELIGVVVVVTLCYVAVQLRQSTNASLENSRQALLDADLALISEFIGYLDEETWQSYMAPVAGIFSAERAKAILQFYTGSTDFVQVVADRLKTTKE